MTDQKPVVYVSVSGGIATTSTIGDVDTILIDWDEVTPDSYLDPSDALDPMEDAVEATVRLPEKRLVVQNLVEMLEWLRANILDFPENSGYEQAREIEKDIVQKLSDNGAHP